MEHDDEGYPILPDEVLARRRAAFDAAGWNATADARQLTNEELLRYAETHRPPQSWYDETEDPFAPNSPATVNTRADRVV